MKKQSYAVFAAALFGTITATAATVINSPGNKVALTVDVVDGTPVYSIALDGKTLVSESPLGLVTNIGDFSSGMKLKEEEKNKLVKSYGMDNIKTSAGTIYANTLKSTYVNPEGKEIAVEWVVADNDVAFHYLLPVQGNTKSLVVEKETTGYRFPENTTTFLTPQSDAMIGWKRTKPSYEEPYKADASMSEPSMYGHGYTFPCLFHVGDDWVLLTETGVDGYYCASHLGEYEGDGLYRIAYPMPEENNGNGSASPGIGLPGATPWRTITVGDNLKPIVETTIVWDLVEPLYPLTEPAQRGKGTWSWILWQDGSINYDDQVKFIDLAAEMGYQNVLIDNWWDTNIGREGMKKLADYAHSKGVNLIIWYSSSGWWNDIVQGPTDIMSRPIPRKKEMKWLRDLGVKAIKVDFFGGDKQETMRLYEDILSDANDYGISVIFHGCTLPRGWERMYPNYVGSEAVLASENLVFGQQFCDSAAFNATLHPFIRNTVGNMEYGGTVLNKRLNKNNDGGTRRMTSDAFELATAVLFQNPVQNFALTPGNLTDAPAEAIEFMKNVPTTWDETRYIDGYPGRYAVIARRHDNKWYIAGVSAVDQPIKLNLDLPMLKDVKQVTLYSDGHKKPMKAVSSAETPLSVKPFKVKDPTDVEMILNRNGGFIIIAE